MEDVYDSKDLGNGVINGMECDFLAVRKDDVDFQVWIAQGDKPYPCKFVVKSRTVVGGPAYGVEFRKKRTTRRGLVSIARVESCRRDGKSASALLQTFTALKAWSER